VVRAGGVLQSLPSLRGGGPEAPLSGRPAEVRKGGKKIGMRTFGEFPDLYYWRENTRI